LNRPDLEQSLHRALALANDRHHEYATLEHLLLALVDDQDAAAVMRACNVDIDKLRRNLVTYVESELEKLVTDGSEDSKPTAGFQRTIQRAVIHVQSSGGAVFFLQEQEMTRYDAINFISHGTAERPGLTESRSTLVEEEPLLQFFAYEHLPEHLKEHSKAFGDLARRLVETLPRNPERTMALRKLLEAKDCAVRARLFK
jgi:ATP-dependent Clp protease ATP-binding subunit ClpA